MAPHLTAAERGRFLTRILGRMADPDNALTFYAEAVRAHRIATEKIARLIYDGFGPSDSEIFKEQLAHSKAVAASRAAWLRTLR